MSFKVLARKWRPKTFAEVVGQEQVVRTLTNALTGGRIAHAWLFAGVRGTGKTTAARILARALNCTKDSKPAADPCGECPSCVDILAGNDLDLFEIDAASHTQVDKTREIIDNVRYGPARNRYKVYIIDEVHMLSAASFNALLKTIEEPPEYAVFILATTELHKIPATILSRCQQFPFRRLETAEIEGRLGVICRSEGFEHDPRSIEVLAEAGNGSLRDAISVLDQAITYGAGALRSDEVERMLGRLDRRFYQELLRSALEGTPAEIVRGVAAVVDAGADPRAAYRDLERYARGALLAKAAPGVALPEGLSEKDAAAIAPLVAGRSYEELLRAYDLLVREDGFVRRAEDPRLAFELVLLRVGELGKLRSIEEVLREIGTGGIRKGTSGAASASASASGASDEETNHPPRFTRIAEVKPVASAAPPPRPAAAPGSVAAFRETLKKRFPRLTGFVDLASEIALDDGKLRLVYAPSHASTKDILDGGKNRTDLEAVATEIFGAATPVEILLSEPPAGSLGEAAASVSREEIRRDRLSGKVHADPLVQAALELFRGEITDVAESGDAAETGEKP